MNHFVRYVPLFLIILLAFAWLKQRVQSPERLLVGTWNERQWQYEKVNAPRDLHRIHNLDTMAQSVKDQLGKHLIIHSAEVWQFNQDGTLLLHGTDTVKQVKWKLKGRGHILELEYANRVMEHYNVSELTPERLVLNFDSDIQVKGIAKLTFENSDYVTQVQ